MAEVTFEQVSKVYGDGTTAVSDLSLETKVTSAMSGSSSWALLYHFQAGAVRNRARRSAACASRAAARHGRVLPEGARVA